MRGGLDNDWLYGGDDHDLLYGGFGDDIMYGGDGWDRISFYDTSATTGCRASLMFHAEIIQDTFHGMDLIGSDIEHLSGTHLDDLLIGNNNANWLWGAGGTSGHGIANNDELVGNGGNDLLRSGMGDSLLNGGNGIDTAAIADVNAGVRVSLLLQGGAQNTGHGMLKLKKIENLSGSWFDDRLTGDKEDNVLAGDSGSDLLKGSAGGDTLYGDGWIGISGSTSGAITLFTDDDFEPGADTLVGNAGNDTLLGGGLGDTLAGSTGADVFLYLNTTDSLADPSPDHSGNSEDLITDLGKGDVIDVSAIDADAAAPGNQAFVLSAFFTSTAGEAVPVYDRDARITYLMMDTDGDSAPEMVIAIAGKHLDLDDNFIG
jgi:Ca2+-binding RTX toxin-like protein